GDARHHRKSQRFPFIAGRSARQAKSREAVEVFSDPAVERCNQPMLFALDKGHPGGRDSENAPHEILTLCLCIWGFERRSATILPVGAMPVEKVATERIAAMWQLHEVALQRILPKPCVDATFIGIGRGDEVWSGM